MTEEMEVLKGYIESLALHEKTTPVSQEDFNNLINDLRDADETSLADYVARLGKPQELEDFIVNTLYG